MKLGEEGIVMDKVVIIGVFDFVNFHVCKAFLDKGIEVRGVQLETEVNEDMINEKRLEIGRNANFSEVSLGDISNQPTDNDTIVLSVFDLYMRYKEDYLLKEELINKIISRNKWENIVILVPSQLLKNVMDSKSKVVIEEFLKRTIPQNENCYLIYLPTVFGPWQPETFMFQSSILTEMNSGKPFRGLREEISDALFVEDTVQSIIGIIENKEPGRYLLQSGKIDQWDLCAALLQINEQGLNNSNEEIREEDITKILVPITVPLSVALTRQIEHAHRINSDK
jgi:nucleoside-diphosphate-sugar epimerase